jgi:hypothetical protein
MQTLQMLRVIFQEVQLINHHRIIKELIVEVKIIKEITLIKKNKYSKKDSKEMTQLHTLN